MFHVLKINYDKPIEVIDQTRPAHLAWLADEVTAGRILLAGRQESGTGGVLITGDISAEDAQDIIDRDPYTLARCRQLRAAVFQRRAPRARPVNPLNRD